MTRLASTPRHLLAALLLASAAPAVAETFQVDVGAQGVAATPLWTPTGVELAPGQPVRIWADPSALWSFAETWGADYLHTAAGFDPWDQPNIVDRFLCAGNHGELIGVVGTDPYLGKFRSPYYDYTWSWTGPQDCTGQVPGYLHVGESAVTPAGFEFTACKAGQLWLGINDDADTGDIGDNGFGVIPVTIEVGPAPAVVDASIDLDPDVLQLGSTGQWVTAYVELTGLDPASIVPGTVELRDADCRSTPADPTAPATVGDHDADGVPDLMVKFPRAAVAGFFAGVTARTTAVLTVSGALADGRRFEGADALRVIP